MPINKQVLIATQYKFEYIPVSSRFKNTQLHIQQDSAIPALSQLSFVTLQARAPLIVKKVHKNWLNCKINKEKNYSRKCRWDCANHNYYWHTLRKEGITLWMKKVFIGQVGNNSQKIWRKINEFSTKRQLKGSKIYQEYTETSQYDTLNFNSPSFFAS